MLSKARIKFIKSLQLKKYRKQEQCFTVQGEKSVLETLRSALQVRALYATADFTGRHVDVLDRFRGELIRVTENDLALLGEYATNNAELPVVGNPENTELMPRADEFVLMLDDVRYPGNLGTIIRKAEWYCITHVVASQETADIYNSKVIQ